jgi:hypothetical protein
MLPDLTQMNISSSLLIQKWVLNKLTKDFF